MRLLLALTLVVGALGFPSTASATHSVLDFQSAVDAMHAVDATLAAPPNDGKHDFAVGGVRDAFDANVGFSVHSGPLGEDAFGHLSSTAPNQDNPAAPTYVRLRVTCLSVAALIASFGGVVTQSNVVPRGTNFLVAVRDTGRSGGEGDGLDFAPGPADTCPAFLPAAVTAPDVETGNILVHDAQP
jgi:hypothetical protein